MTTTVSDTPASASDLRTKLADLLREQNIARTPAVDAALRSVPRHLFLPGVSLTEAYVNEAVYTKHDDSGGASISAASQPAMVAMMLEQLHLEPGAQAHKDNDGATDPGALAGVLETARHEVWTGVLFAPRVSFEWLDLWLACRLANPLMRMNVEPAAKHSGLVSPMFPTVAMATTTADGSLAYLTIRRAAPAPDSGKRYEVGVIGHGPTGQHLAEHVGQHISTWDTGFRTRSVHIAIPDTPPTADPDQGRFVLHRPHHPLTVTWE